MTDGELVGVIDGVIDVDGVILAVGVIDGVAVTEGVTEGVIEIDAVTETVGVIDGVTLTVGVTLVVGVIDTDELGVNDGVILTVPVGVGVGVEVIEGQRVRCRLYTKRNSTSNVDKHILEETTCLSIPFIPFVPVLGGKKEAFFRARPLLFDIARLNLHHWSVSADLAETIQ